MALPVYRVPALCAIIVAAGCGPVVYVSEVSRHASDAVDAARAAHADKYAPYWWTRATQYLEEAREVAAHADFQGANRFGQLAAEAADQATREALIAARDPSKRPLGLPPDVAPAKEAPALARPAPAPAPAQAPVPAKPAPAKGAAAAKDSAAAKDAAPAKGSASAKDSAPTKELAPAKDPVPAKNPVPAKDPARKRMVPAKGAP